MSYDNEFPTRADRRLQRVLSVVVLVCAVFIIWVLLNGCSPVKRMGGIAAKHPDAALVVCNNMFPPKVTTETKYEYVEGQTVTNWDTVTVDCDSVFEQAGRPGSTVRTKLVRVPCPPSTFRVDTAKTTITITIQDTKQIKLLNKQLTDSQSDVARLKKGRNNWRWIGIGGIVLLVAGFVLKLKKIV